MDEYVIWDFAIPGISFNVNSGRITIFKATLVALGYPEYFRFRFDPEQRIFGIEPCDMKDGGSYRLPKVFNREHYELKCKDLVRFVYETCGWKKKLTYRAAGELYSPDEKLIFFDLQRAYEIHEGRMKEA